jgi:eukaryotic-like serine/threonine-protein kinase
MSSIDPIPDSEKSEEEKPTTTFAFEQMSLPQANPVTVVNPEKQGGSSQTVFADTGSAASVWNRLFPADVVSEGGVQQTIPDPKGIKLDHFVLEERIGIGGMGSVFRAIDERLERVVALKILSPTQTGDPGSVMRFRNEAKAAAKLDHDNISRVFYIGEDSGLNFIAFEYVTGTNIRDLIRRYGQLDPAEAINYALQIAYALKHTSAASVVHRDIKPSNIIVTTSGRAKLVDLGLARKQNADSLNELTVAGTTLGTFDYISPEQAKDPRNVDVRSDIYSLGCTLYHMLTGSAPYPDGTMMQKLLSHQENDPPNPADKNKKVTPGLAAIVQRMMASEPRYRHETADELIHALLMVSGSYGMKGMNPEGLIWRASQTTGKRFWERNLGWFTTVALLLIIVFSINKFQPDEQPKQVFTGSSENDKQSELTLPPDQKNPGNLVANLDSSPSDQNTGIISNDKNGVSNNPTLNPEKEAEKIFDSRNPSLSEDIKNPQPNPGKQNGKTISDIAKDDPIVIPPSKTKIIEEKPRISVISSNGENPQNYPTVESALSEAEDGSTIELLYNGTIGTTSEKIWKLNNKSITIRAGNNSAGELYRPVIKFDTERFPDDDDPRFITISGGSLELLNIDLRFQFKSSAAQSEWELFSLNGPDQLRMRGVSVVVENSRYQDVSLVSLSRQNNPITEDDDSNSGTISTINSLEVRFINCYIAGNCQLVSSRHLLPGQIIIENSILAIHGPVIHCSGSNNMPMNNQQLKLTMEHVTCLLQNGLIRMETGELPRSVLPLHVSARNNIFASWKVDQPLVSMNGKNTREEFRGLLQWIGEKNFFENFQSFWYIQPERISEKTENMNFTNWKVAWKGTTTSSMLDKIVWRNNWKKKDVLEIRTGDLELGDNNSNNAKGIPLWQASDEGNVGANLIQFFTMPFNPEEVLKSKTSRQEKLRGNFF